MRRQTRARATVGTGTPWQTGHGHRSPSVPETTPLSMDTVHLGPTFFFGTRRGKHGHPMSGIAAAAAAVSKGVAKAQATKCNGNSCTYTLECSVPGRCDESSPLQLGETQYAPSINAMKGMLVPGNIYFSETSKELVP